MWNDAFADRRKAQRWPSAGVIVLRTRGSTVRGRIADLSTSGVRLRVESWAALEALAGRRVGIELHLEGLGTEWLCLRGCVVRVSRAFLTIVIAFDSTPADFADIVEREGRNAVVH